MDDYRKSRTIEQLGHLLMTYRTYDGRSVVSFSIGDANYYAILDAINLLKEPLNEKQPD